MLCYITVNNSSPFLQDDVIIKISGLNFSQVVFSSIYTNVYELKSVIRLIIQYSATMDKLSGLDLCLKSSYLC